MKKVILFFIAVIIFFAFTPGTAQEKAAVSGTVFIPDISRERRTFRGRIYRNRLSAHDKRKEDIKTVTASFSDVIVSAHPLSYVLAIDSLPPVKILQVNAEFIPRVVALTPGTEVQFINRDNFFHNVFSITPGARFNIGRKPTGEVERRKIDQLGEVKLFCDIHAQMNATILCLDTPYFSRLETSGHYTLSDLPEGNYQIRIYHPDLTGINETIEVKKNQALIKNFTLSR